MEWSSEAVMEFLDLYEGEPAIWNPNNPHHKDRNHVYDAWKRIESQLSFDCSFKELKKKKENLMATYRKLVSRVKKSTATGSGSNEVFKPEWFAYDKMASFLHTIYTPKKTKGSERPENGPDNEEDLFNNDEQIESSDVSSEPQQAEGTAATVNAVIVNEGGPPAAKKSKAERTANADKRMDEAYAYLKQVAATPKVVKDEVYMFCELLGLKLRALDEEKRETAMHQINTFMYDLKTNRQLQQQQPRGFQNYNPNPPYISFQQPRDFQTYNLNPLPSPHGSHESSNSYISLDYGSHENSTSNSTRTSQSAPSMQTENEDSPTAATLFSNFNV